MLLLAIILLIIIAGRSPDDLPKKRRMVQMSLRLFERMPRELPSKPIVSVEKNYIFSEHNLNIQAKLDSGVYAESDTIHLSLQVKRPGGHGVRKIKITTMQQVINAHKNAMRNQTHGPTSPFTIY